MEALRHQHPKTERQALINRLRRIAGQLNGIEKMVNADRDCAEVLTQLVSARRALKSFAEKLIHSHMRHCIGNAHSPGQGKRKLRELLIVLERYVE